MALVLFPLWRQNVESGGGEVNCTITVWLSIASAISPQLHQGEDSCYVIAMKHSRCRFSVTEGISPANTISGDNMGSTWPHQNGVMWIVPRMKEHT